MNTTLLLLAALLLPPAPIALLVQLRTQKPRKSLLAGTLPTLLLATTWALGVSARLQASGPPTGTDAGPRTPNEAIEIALLLTLASLALSALSTLAAKALSRLLQARHPPTSEATAAKKR